MIKIKSIDVYQIEVSIAGLTEILFLYLTQQLLKLIPMKISMA
jgi:hypothetical protein